ncbi:MAG: hypothetical protein ACRDRH_20985 [Pseudonocardia sp.]
MTGVAIALAVVGAVCFAGAAVLQHRAVDAVTGPGPGDALTLRGLRSLVRRPGWLAGFALAGGGAGLHAAALVLAPLSVVQPIGVLAVPFAVLLVVQRTRRRPAGTVLAGVALSVTGVVAFVAVTARTAVHAPVPDGATLVATASATALVLVLAVIGALGSGWMRSVACATAGAVAFGLVSALLRALSLHLADQRVTGGFAGPEVIATATGVGVALLVGGWLVQQGFAAGPPEGVIACLTVVDPIVAVVLGAVLLGEGAATPVDTALLLAACTAAAVTGVLMLTRHQGRAGLAAAPRSRPGPDRAPRRPLPVR